MPAIVILKMVRIVLETIHLIAIFHQEINAQNNQMESPCKMDHTAYQMTNNNAFMIKVNFAILHQQQINGAIYIITLKVVLLKMDLIATIYIKGIASLM